MLSPRALAVAALPPLLALHAASASAPTISNGAWSFVSAPNLHPPAITVEVPAATSAGNPQAGAPEEAAGEYLFLAPIPDYASREPFIGQPGPEILEADGNPVWVHPLGRKITIGRSNYSEVAMDFHPSTYDGQPVLVWWEGYITPEGFGNGVWEIVNEHYQPVGKIAAPPGYELDFHALKITPVGTAYILANRVAHLSLRCCGGPANGELYDQVLFEVNLKTGAVVWVWDPLQHVPLRESYTTAPSDAPWDPYHLNSISFGPSGNPIVSARNTWAAYWINRTSARDNGAIFATLGGKRSSFKLAPGARFAWQHDVRQQQGEQISVFDDEAAPEEGKQSRGLLLSLDFAAHTASVVDEYLLPHPAFAGSQGNVALLGNGNVFVGWGQLPYLTEYSAAGSLLFEATLPGSDESYRSFRDPWVGLPVSGPAIAVHGTAGGVNVYASWNGATTVASWQLLAGHTPSTLSSLGQHVERQGFETTITTPSRGPYYAVQAIDSAGHVLATSPAVTASS